MPVNKGQNKSLATLCKPDKLSRCDYFSDTYTVVLTMGEGEQKQKKLMDITHISLPFKPHREKAVMEYFDIDEDGMQELYNTLAACITNNARTTTYLNRKRNTQSILSILKAESVKKKVGRGSDIYIITDHMRPLIQTYFNGETTVKQIVNFGARLAKMVADIHQSEEESVNLRVPDPEQIFVGDDGKYVFGCFHYAYNPRSGRKPIPVAETAPLHISPPVIQGGGGDEGTDMYSIASMLWSLLNGDGFDKPTPTGAPPKYCPESLVPVLEMGFNADPEMFSEFKKKLLKADKELSKPENNGSQIVPVPLAERCIESPVAMLDFGVESEIVEQPPVAAEAVAETVPEPVAAQESIPEPVPEERPAPAAPPQEEPSVVGVMPYAYTAAKPVEQAVELSDDDFVQDRVKVLDTTEYVKATESESDIVADSTEELLSFVADYHEPEFLLNQLFIVFAMAVVIGFVVWMSVSQHLISLW